MKFELLTPESYWLLKRHKRTLNEKEILHYKKILVYLQMYYNTIRELGEVDIEI